MIKSLYIKDYLLIPDIQIDFQKGLTVITGETGAGKSLIVDSLELALGARADPGIIRNGCDKAEIFVIFEIHDTRRIEKWLKEYELYDGAECIIHRVIFPDRASRAYINGRPATLQSVRNLGSLLVEIHGQHEHQSLLKSAAQRNILDGFAGILDKTSNLSSLAASIRSEISRRDNMIDRQQNLSEQLSLLRHQSSVLDQLQPEQDEFSRLKNELARATHAEELSTGLHEIAQRLFYADNATVSGTLTESIRQMGKLSEYDPELETYANMLEEARFRTDDAAREILSISSRSEYDPAEITSIEERMASLQQQARIHDVSADELPGELLAIGEQISNLETELAGITTLDERINQLQAEHRSAASEISKIRKNFANAFSVAITEQMQKLGMEGGVFEVELIEHNPVDYAVFGWENVNFLVSTNPGQQNGALSKVASGGELSRLSLAIQTVAAEVTQVHSLVFDEIDVGIGGKVAERVGRLLRSLGKSTQIFCITHLPQVAAQGDHQLNVNKKTENTSSVEIRLLDHEQRISEIARMLGGVKITTRTTEHAKEMLIQGSM